MFELKLRYECKFFSTELDKFQLQIIYTKQKGSQASHDFTSDHFSTSYMNFIPKENTVNHFIIYSKSVLPKLKTNNTPNSAWENIKL